MAQTVIDECRVQYAPRMLADFLALISNPELVSGFMDAPMESIVARKASTHTGIKIDHIHGLDRVIQTIHPRDDHEDFQTRNRMRDGRIVEGFENLFIHQMMPGFVVLENAGYDSRLPGMEQVQEWILHFVLLGYRGLLSYEVGNTRHETWECQCSVVVSFGKASKGGVEGMFTIRLQRDDSDRHVQFYGPVLEYILKHKAS